VGTILGIAQGDNFGVTPLYIVYIRERHHFSLVCTFEKATKKFNLKVDVQKASQRFRGKLAIDVLVSSNLP
jgi:hypothetical protein